MYKPSMYLHSSHLISYLSTKIYHLLLHVMELLQRRSTLRSCYSTATPLHTPELLQHCNAAPRSGAATVRPHATELLQRGSMCGAPCWLRSSCNAIPRCGAPCWLRNYCNVAPCYVRSTKKATATAVTFFLFFPRTAQRCNAWSYTATLRAALSSEPRCSAAP
jgi:hypothetical protein